jgi:hypothetical protein
MNAVLASLGAFLAAFVRPPTPLARAIRLAIVIKLIAIAGIAGVMLPDARQRAVDASAISRLIGPPTPTLDRGGH